MGCIEGFDDRQSYLEHRAIKHKKAGSELCEICKKRFITKTALFMHRKQHFVRYECVTCGKRHPDLCSISRHYKRKHEIELEFKCDHCDYTTEYECVTCGKRHPDLCSISRHYKRKHEIGLEFKHFGPTVPLAIPLVVPSERAMRGHAKSHKDWFMCYYCPMPKPFTREGHLKLHHLKKHTFPCMICEKKFGYRRYLKQHTASKHPGFDAASYCECDCKTCGERFRSFISLSQHLRQYSTHDPLLKFECDECAELFVSKHSIQNHITMRHLKPFKVFQAEMAQAVLSAGAEHKRLKRQLIRERRLLRAASRPLDLSESDFVKHFCLRKSQFLALCNDICPLLPDPQRTTAVRPDIKVCDADLRILHVDASFGGAASDSHVWGSSPVSALMERLHDSGEESRLLGDSGYAQRPWLMTPILNAEPNTPEEHYNYQHDRTRNVVGRCIGVLKTRWRCLLAHRTMYYHPVKAGKVVNACVVLHNLINDPHIDIDEEEMARDRARQPSQVRTDDYEDVKNAARFSRTREAVVDRLWSTR